MKMIKMSMHVLVLLLYARRLIYTVPFYKSFVSGQVSLVDVPKRSLLLNLKN